MAGDGAGWARFSEQNRRAWEEIADVRIGRWSNRNYTSAFFAAGGCSLDARLVDALGDVAGQRVLHLMCATGEDSLSLAVLGAEVVAVDISERQIELARQKARAAEVSVAFLAADIAALPEAVSAAQFDMVYTGGGVLVWVPDIVTWAAVIAAALRPGGRFVLWEYHPAAMCWEPAEGALQVGRDYFSGPGPVETRGWTHFAEGRDAETSKFEFDWTLGEIVTALADAGLRVTRLSEYPTDAEWKFGEMLAAAARLPGLLLLAAERQ
jgi:ubiquinone/menaquinone biosynthesis C-methylase UbiE